MLKIFLSFLILLTLIGIVILISFYSSYSWPNDYAIVFDAGSSGTRMYIYEWRADFSVAKGDPLKISQKLSCKTDDGGIDKIKSQTEFIKKFSTCLNKAQIEIPESRKTRTYLFLAATAGMRLLEVRNKTAANEILGFIRDYFQKKTNFLFKNSSQVRIISGQEEGTNAWISANYYLNYFESGSNKSTHKSQGILDLGGASTQIVFVPASPNLNNSDYFSKIRIYGINYQPYSHSFLCWGVNEIALLYQTYLISSNNYEIESMASCYPKGSQIEINSNQILSSPCANGLVFNNTYNFTVNITRIEKNQIFTFKGKSNESSCASQMQIILPQPKCNYDKCSFNGVYQPSIEHSNFMGFSSFFYAFNNTGNLFAKKYFNDMEGFKDATNQICSMTLTQLQELNIENNGGLTDKYLKTQCFSNLYALQLLTNYGFIDFHHLKISDTVNDYSLNWALGYLINELNRDDFLPFEEPPRKLKFSIFLPSTLICCLFILFLVAIMAYHHMNLKTKLKRPHEETLLNEPNVMAQDMKINSSDNNA